MNIRRLIRVIHRDLGYLMVGISLVYGISGIYLNHISNKKDPAFHTESKSIQLPANLNDEELSITWKSDKNLPVLNKVMRIDESHLRLLLDGGVGVYNVENGKLDYEKYKKRILIYWINRLHYNKVKGWSWVADIYAVSLVVLAISGLFMIKGKKGIAGSGKWYLIIGLLIPILFGILLL